MLSLLPALPFVPMYLHSADLVVVSVGTAVLPRTAILCWSCSSATAWSLGEALGCCAAEPRVVVVAYGHFGVNRNTAVGTFSAELQLHRTCPGAKGPFFPHHRTFEAVSILFFLAPGLQGTSYCYMAFPTASTFPSRVLEQDAGT